MNRLSRLMIVCAAAVATTWSSPVPTAAEAPRATPPPLTPGRELPVPLRGVTTESVSRLPALVHALARHQHVPTLRIVFQPGAGPASYAQAVRRLRAHAYLLGQPVDSTAMRDLSLPKFRQRFAAYVDRFGPRVDLWEIGNEVNGEWVGRPKDIDAKVGAAFDIVERNHRDQHLRSLLTLNFWPSRNCYAKPWERTRAFARQLPARVRRGVDVIAISFYETACEPRARPSDAAFVDVLTDLGRIFPGARLAIGEVGAQRRADGLPRDPSLAEKRRIAKRYYGLQPTLARALGTRYIGGYFWWYYYQDAVTAPRRTTLWPTLDRLLTGL